MTVWIGESLPAGGGWFNGKIDEVRVYNRALSASEISTLYNYHISPPSSGLVARWKFDESGGTTAADSAGGHNGALVNGPTFTSAGKLAGALTLNGSNQYVSVPDVASLELAGSWTVSAWVNLPSLPTSGNYFGLVTKGQTLNNSTNYGLYVGNGWHCTGVAWVLNFNDNADTGSYHACSTSSISTGVWYHIVGVWDGTTESLYVNGTLAGTNVPGVLPASGSGVNLTIGVDDYGAGYANATIDDVRIYNRALSVDEIYGLYRTSSPVCSSPSGYEGDVIYNGGTNHVVQFCDNAGWRPLGPVPGAGGSGCTNPVHHEGDMIYNNDKGYMQYCDGTSWIAMGQSYYGPQTGLVGWWKFDETSGSTASDSSGTGNTGTLINAPAWAPGTDNGALTFNGSNQEVSFSPLWAPA